MYSYAHIEIVILLFIVLAVCLRILAMRRSYAEKLTWMLYRDASSGLHNRIWLEHEINHRLERMDKQKEDTSDAAIVVFQIRQVDVLASTYGQDIINEMMKRLGSSLQREKWIQAVGVRSGSGQVIVFTRPMSVIQLRLAVQTAMLGLEYMDVGDMNLRMPLIAGISTFKGLPRPDAKRVILQATLAMQVSDGIRFYDDKIIERRQFATQVENCMRRGLDNHEFQVWYQPKYDLASHRYIGAEALVRWDSPELGFLMPGQFIGIFERTGFVTQLDFYILDAVFRYQRDRRQAGLPVVPISVNQSRLHIQEQNYLNKMKRLVRQFGTIDGIELELTETAFDFESSSQRAAAVDVIRTLKEMGFRISLDDFGSGYSDLSLLNTLPLDVMKLDRTLLVASEDSARMQSVLTNTIRMGHDLGMRVICEGIETAEQEKLLLDCGCHCGQGFFYGRPMPEREFSRFLQERA